LNAHEPIRVRHIGIYVAVPSIARDQLLLVNKDPENEHHNGGHR
jgi:hypothetical protein